MERDKKSQKEESVSHEENLTLKAKGNFKKKEMVNNDNCCREIK